ncbi:element excision factor XisH family protein [Alkalinema pantanalense CENA528]|uniref:element excision factor XisH family protein n=1 Tax=Alkalinema pantanalense TaxID=1620705 RepID=UPI003D6F1EBB
MSAKDIYHDTVRAALIKDGWTITHDPLILTFNPRRQLKIDLGAEQLIGAERENQLIAVEIKTFLASSTLSEFHAALGQFLNYRLALKLRNPDRQLFLAIPKEVYQGFFAEEFTQLSVAEYDLKIIVFDVNREEILQWLT